MDGTFQYEFYHKGFFGYSLEQDFTYFSFWHFLPIILLGAAIWLTWKYREKLAVWKGEEHFRFILAAILILNEGFYYWRLMYVGNGGGDSTQKQLITFLPLQVCEWMAYLSAFMLMKKSRSMFDICYYVCLTLGIIPYLTPAVIMQTGPTYARYYQFWLEHILPVYAVFYMIFVHGFRANWRRVYKPFALLAVMATLAIIANTTIPDANFMYLASGTAGDSIANILPESIPVRLVLYVGILIVLFALVSLPHVIPEIKAYRKKKKTAEAEASLAVAETVETANEEKTE